jgi:hypothetical protein
MDAGEGSSGSQHVALDAESLYGRRSLPFEATGHRRGAGIKGRHGRGVPGAIFCHDGPQQIAHRFAFPDEPMDRGLTDRRMFVECVEGNAADYWRGGDRTFEDGRMRTWMSRKLEQGRHDHDGFARSHRAVAGRQDQVSRSAQRNELSHQIGQAALVPLVPAAPKLGHAAMARIGNGRFVSAMRSRRWASAHAPIDRRPSAKAGWLQAALIRWSAD